jgi:FlaA1/EpsC-like NDP-sugar epimerase
MSRSVILFDPSLLLRLRNRHFLLLDALTLCVTPALALALRVDGVQSLATYAAPLLLYTTLALAIRLVVFYGAGLYSRFWRYASVGELTQIGAAVLISTIIIVALFFAVRIPALGLCVAPEPACALPRSIPFIDAMLVVLAVGLTRFSVRTADLYLQRGRAGQITQRVLIVGAGEAGAMIARELRTNPQLGLDPTGFIDDDPDKRGVRIRGLQVLGNRAALPDLVEQHQIDQVIIAMPTAPGKTIREVLAICEQAGVPAKTMPGMYELLGGQVSVNQLRNVEIEDLLRREPVQTDIAAVQELLAGRCVLVTGGGGSIGSELCRQILRCRPAKLVIVGHGENSVFEIQQELQRAARQGERGEGRQVDKGEGKGEAWDPRRQGYGDTDERTPSRPIIVPVIADVRFAERLQCIFQQHRPQVVFHAAAHKHVPLMEENPSEAVTNNVLGTRNLLEAALASGVEHFVLISTDKAVNPTSIMGASKRLAELLVLDAARRSGRAYGAVRFGNVLGSRGSVVLTFKQQIAAGGPVTVTDPEITRFFMTIPEAVQLVLQAAVLGRGGETFVLDMGEPVRIVDLARDLIGLSGLEEGRDIDIVYTGLRPGEKLYEELFVIGERNQRTTHTKIFIAVGEPGTQMADRAGVAQAIDDLIALAQQGDQVEVRRRLQTLLPEFQVSSPGTVTATPGPAHPSGLVARPASSLSTTSAPQGHRDDAPLPAATPAAR